MSLRLLPRCCGGGLLLLWLLVLLVRCVCGWVAPAEREKGGGGGDVASLHTSDERRLTAPLPRRCSPIKSVTPTYPGKVVCKMGIFPRIPAPEWESFALHRHDWQGKHEGMVQYKIKSLGEKMEGSL